MRAATIGGLSALAATLLVAAGHAAPPVLSLGRMTLDGRWDGWSDAHALAVTTDGFLWIGRTQGLVRFDGRHFLTMDADSHPAFARADVRVLRAARNGGLWVGLQDGGLLRLGGDGFTRVDLPTGGAVTGVLEEPGIGVWVARADSLLLLAGAAPARALTAPPGITAIEADGRGRLWVGTAAGLFRREADAFVRASDPLPVQALTVDRQGTLHVALDHRLLRIDDQGPAPVAVVVRNYVGLGLVGAPLPQVWVGREMAGVTGLVADGNDVSIGSGDGLPDLRVVALAADALGGLWGVTGTGTLFVLRQRRVESFGPAQGLSGAPSFGVAQTRDGALWASLVGGLARVDGAGVTMFRHADRLWPSPCLGSAATGGEGDLWIANCGDGLIRAHAGGFETIKGPRALGVWAGRNGLLVAGKTGALHAFSRETGFRLLADGRALCEDAVRTGACPHQVLSLAEDAAGDLWLGTRGDGLYRIHAGRVERHFTTADGLPATGILGLTLDATGALWLATDGGGLARVLAGAVAALPADRSNLPRSLHGVIEDRQQRLWMTSDDGVFRIPRAQVEEALAGRAGVLRALRHGLDDGMQSARCARDFSPPLLQSAEGPIVVPTVSGLSLIEAGLAQPPAGALRIDRVDLDGSRVSQQDRLSLRRGGGNLVVRFTVPALVPGLMAPVVRARLSGWSDWAVAGPAGALSWSGVAAGSYLLEAQVLRPEETAPAAMISLPIELVALHQTAWFRGVALAALLAALGGVFWLRQAQLNVRARAVREERRRLAHDLHDALAVSFTGIGYQLDTLAEVLGADAPAATRKLLDDARAMVRHSRQEARRSIWHIRSQALEARSLIETLRAIAAEAQGVGQAAVEIVDEGIAVEPDAPLADALLRIAQEAIVNAMAHGHAKHVIVKLRVDRQRAQLIVTDDGKGLGEGGVAKMGFGLLGMKERAEVLGGHFEMRPAPDRGTVVEVSVPLSGGNAGE